MPVVLDVTSGGATSNAFADVAWANLYHATRPSSDTWTNADPDQQIAALIQATRFLCNMFNWTGAATVPTQRLVWPRIGMTNQNGFPIDPMALPDELKDANAEFARQLLEADRAADDDAEKHNLQSVHAGPVSVSFMRGYRSDLVGMNADLQLLGPDQAWHDRLIPDAVLDLLIDSWYERPQLGQPFFFAAAR
jgi:hypothetical protein